MLLPSANEQWFVREFRFAPEHPTSSGHFPGNPIIPGAVLLDCVLRMISETDAHLSFSEIRYVKFLRPVRPGEQVIIRWRPVTDSEIKFEMKTDNCDEPILIGTAKASGA